MPKKTTFHAHFKRNLAKRFHKKGDPPIETLDGFHAFLKDYLTLAEKNRLFEIYRTLEIGEMITRDRRAVYRLYGMLPEQRERTRIRGVNRRQFIKDGLVSKGDGTEIHHKDGNIRNNKRSNLLIVNVCEHRRLHGHVCELKTTKKKRKKRKKT